MEFITETYRIRITEVDAHSQLTIPALNGLLQEMAWRHSVVAKVSVHELSAQHNISWVLSRLKIWIDRLPNYDETVTVKTYVQGVDKYFYHRDFKVFDSAGIEIIRANSVWGLMDIVKRRLTSVPEWMLAMTLPCTEKNPVEKVSGKIAAIKNIETERHFDIRWHDIDSNQHVNNTKYVEWLMESIPSEILNNGTLNSIDMIFKNESILGDKITTQSQSIEQGFIHRIINQDGQELVTGETIWA
ncbi:MAG: acyl-ACP thioesterase domain-containing protein [Bacteroidota bacterium]|jgi:acyl-ACP thioesterase